MKARCASSRPYPQVHGGNDTEFQLLYGEPINDLIWIVINSILLFEGCSLRRSEYGVEQPAGAFVF